MSSTSAINLEINFCDVENKFLLIRASGWYLNWSKSFPSLFLTPLTLSVLYRNTGQKGVVMCMVLYNVIALKESCLLVFNSPLPLNLLSEITQHLTKLNLAELISALPLHLQFIKHAATHPQINPVVRINHFEVNLAQQ